MINGNTVHWEMSEQSLFEQLRGSHTGYGCCCPVTRPIDGVSRSFGTALLIGLRREGSRCVGAVVPGEGSLAVKRWSG